MNPPSARCAGAGRPRIADTDNHTKRDVNCYHDNTNDRLFPIFALKPTVSGRF
jgi:hypothetical protein